MYQLRFVCEGKVIKKSAWFTAHSQKELVKFQQYYVELHPECSNHTLITVNRSLFWGKFLNFLVRYSFFGAEKEHH